MKNPKICLVCSSGGHLIQIFNLEPWWNRYKHFWVTFNKDDSVSLLKGEQTYFAVHPTNRNFINLIINTCLAARILYRERPRVIFSTGAGVAIPFCYLGKLFGAKVIYLEVYDRIDSATLTGKIVYPIADKFIVQWDEQKKFYPKAELWGQAV